ncbi:MAG: hypothetical protein MUE38_05780 [Flavihumibacter sp.]|jgi:hypothetical protein|nr:hypothetical protein [Flavihumibacter sp.]
MKNYGFIVAIVLLLLLVAFCLYKSNKKTSDSLNGAKDRKGISLSKAMGIAMEWHGGQGSYLYQFGSSGEFISSNRKKYIEEVSDNISRFAQKSKQKKELNLLLDYFQSK